MTAHSSIINFLEENPDMLEQTEARLPIVLATKPLCSRFSDDDLALQFSEKHKNDLRYTAKWGTWHLWSQTRWAEESTMRAYDMARKICRSAAAAEGVDKQAVARITSATTVGAVERMAKADRSHAMTVEQWDADPWLLNTPQETINLRSGEARRHRREDYCTKQTLSGLGDGCGTWLHLLDTITDGDDQLQAFLRRVAGYLLTGATSEHALFFLYGTGANGKSTFINTLIGLLGDYAKIAPVEAFVASAHDRHPCDIAGLQGARLVVANETEDGQRWAESKIKSLTGGDVVTARRMRQDYFEFTPQFKLVIAGNHKPSIRSVDEALRRRLHMIPFAVTIPVSKRDSTLPEKLKAEWPGILRWCLDGCLEWQRVRLNPPEIVKSATDDYLATEDALGRWLEERCVVGQQFFASSSSLYRNWKEWAEAVGEYAGSQKRFAQTLGIRSGIASNRTRNGRGFRGLAMKHDTGVTDVTDSPI
jgi:putative DNA primase/helicase